MIKDDILIEQFSGKMLLFLYQLHNTRYNSFNRPGLLTDFEREAKYNKPEGK